MASEKAFVDTSAFYALMDRTDSNHEEAVEAWRFLLERDVSLHTCSYVVVETLALLQSRLGFKAADLWYRDVLAVVSVLWIDESVHKEAHALWLGLSRKRVSFVDCTSFVAMRRSGLGTAFCFDRHFREQGFRVNRID